MEPAGIISASDGKAGKNDSGRARLTTINGKKYAFSDTGKMLYGWVSEDGTMVTDESDWASGLLYCGEEDDGAAAIAQWVLLDVDDPEADDDADGYWFYFGTNGKKTWIPPRPLTGASISLTREVLPSLSGIMHRRCSESTASASEYKYYNTPEQCWLADGWFLTVPSGGCGRRRLLDDEVYWFYADKKGELVVSRIRSIDNYKYAFNEKGEMLEGLYALPLMRTAISLPIEEIENIDEMPG